MHGDDFSTTSAAGFGFELTASLQDDKDSGFAP